MDRTSLGDRMKWYERQYATRMLPFLPVLARIDGRSFSQFTKGLGRPFDTRLSVLMTEVTKFLVEETNSRCGYTQSDEISLVWIAEDFKSELPFGGKLAKMVSIGGALATAKFNRLLPAYLPEKSGELPVFDCRIWQVPARHEAANYFLWREMDATRNSVSAAARTHYSHRQCYGKSGADMQEMLFQKGVNWNDYPRFFKRGTYVRRRTLERKLTSEELADLPPKHDAHANPDMVVRRSAVKAEDFPPLGRIANREEVILFGGEPRVLADKEA